MKEADCRIDNVYEVVPDLELWDSVLAKNFEKRVQAKTMYFWFVNDLEDINERSKNLISHCGTCKTKDCGSCNELQNFEKKFVHNNEAMCPVCHQKHFVIKADRTLQDSKELFGALPRELHCKCVECGCDFKLEHIKPDGHYIIIDESET